MPFYTFSTPAGECTVGAKTFDEAFQVLPERFKNQMVYTVVRHPDPANPPAAEVIPLPRLAQHQAI